VLRLQDLCALVDTADSCFTLEERRFHDSESILLIPQNRFQIPVPSVMTTVDHEERVPESSDPVFFTRCGVAQMEAISDNESRPGDTATEVADTLSYFDLLGRKMDFILYWQRDHGAEIE